MSNTDNQFVVQLPADASRRSLIDQLAVHVSHSGVEYEQSVLDQHAHARTLPSHPYSFLFAIDLPDNLYYRWRVYSLRSGGTLQRWDTRPFQMIPHGPLWLPPVEGANVRQDEQRPATAAAAAEVEGGMSGDEVDELQRLLSTLTLQRSSILAAMGWCMERAAAATYIVRSICAALLSSSADSCRRVSLLYLLSDLLYNSSAPVRNASLYRREASQPGTLHAVWTAFSPHQPSTSKPKDGSDDDQPGAAGSAVNSYGVPAAQRHRVGRKEREVVLGVLRTWQTWSLFESDKIEQWMWSVRGLPTAAAGGAAIALPVTSTIAATPDVDVDDVDGVPLTLLPV